MMNKIKILMILDNLNRCDGISSYVMNYYKNMNLDEFEIDFLISKSNNGVDENYKNTIINNGGKIILRNNITNKDMIKEIFKLKTEIDFSKYDIVHSHIVNMGYFYLKEAKKSGVKLRILHSHTTKLWAKNFFTNIRNTIFKELTKKYANYNFACSNLAGKYLFDKKNFILIKNAINLEKYQYNEKIRENYRKNLKIDENTKVYGHVGRFNVQKNHKFLLEVYKKIQLKEKNTKLLLIGKGELQKDIENEIKIEKLENNVTILGERNDVENLMQAMDVFLLPSLFEGLPIVGIEAQAIGLPCYFSNNITKEVRVLDNSKFINIDSSNDWAKEILDSNYQRKNKKDVLNEMRKAGYDIKVEAKKLEQIYKKMIMEKI